MLETAAVIDSIPKPAFGTPAPWFKANVLDVNAQYNFHTVAGRVTILFFMGSLGSDDVRSVHDFFLSQADRFDDRYCCFFGVTSDREDAVAGRVRTRLPGIRYILDSDRSISEAYGASLEGSGAYEPYILVLDRQFRVTGRFLLPQADGKDIVLPRESRPSLALMDAGHNLRTFCEVYSGYSPQAGREGLDRSGGSLNQTTVRRP